MFVTTDCVFTKRASPKNFAHLSPLFTATVKHTHTRRRHKTPSLTEKRAMTRLMFAILLCALGTTQAFSQNVVSQQLLELDEDERNASFTLILKDSDRRCDQVIRTLFNGTVLGVDEWEALCKDRNAYSISVLVEPDETTVTSLTCRELLATSRMLLRRAGSKSKATGCRIK
jgi:hypothetical protein